MHASLEHGLHRTPCAREHSRPRESKPSIAPGHVCHCSTTSLWLPGLAPGWSRARVAVLPDRPAAVPPWVPPRAASDAGSEKASGGARDGCSTAGLRGTTAGINTALSPRHKHRPKPDRRRSSHFTQKPPASLSWSPPDPCVSQHIPKGERAHVPPQQVPGEHWMRARFAEEGRAPVHCSGGEGATPLLKPCSGQPAAPSTSAADRNEMASFLGAMPPRRTAEQAPESGRC